MKEKIEMTLQSVWTSLEKQKELSREMKTFVDFLSTFSGLHFGRIWASGRREMKMPLSFCLLLLLLQRGSHQDQNGSRDIWMQIWQQQNAIPMHLKSSLASQPTPPSSRQPSFFSIINWSLFKCWKTYENNSNKSFLQEFILNFRAKNRHYNL